MKVLLTGATGYIAKRLLPVLLDNGHEVVCCVRDKSRFDLGKYQSKKLSVVQADFLDPASLENIPKDLEAAYYLIHSMAGAESSFEKLEAESARNFKAAIERTGARQVIYLSGIVNEKQLSRHLKSRKSVETILSVSSTFSLTTLRAGIIVGSGSASFEIIRDLVEKLPVMIAPRWLKTRCQPIAIRNVIEFLNGVLGLEATWNKSYDIGGPDILTYKEMLMGFAEVRGLRRKIFIVPVMTPKLSSYWLYFVTATSYTLAKNLVDSMKVEVVCQPNNLAEILGIKPIPYKEAIRMAFDKIDQQQVLSSWSDAQSSPLLGKGLSGLIDVPVNGCFIDKKERKIRDPQTTLANIWRIGGRNGWYYANWLWNLRGFIDKIFGGVGLRRGRSNADDIFTGQSLDFWRVIFASREDKRLLLYAEMKLPGEAWLEFKIVDNTLYQTATFRPLGLWGRTYWYLVLPFHYFIFNGMIERIAK
ncbi:MAG TPA: SDR family oxidoreductase [Sphingobacteriaceae bacterium]